MALDEDLLLSGDITSQPIFESSHRSNFTLVSKDRGVLAGEEVFAAVCLRVDQDIDVRFEKHDGDNLASGEGVATLTGRTLSVLTAERSAINFLAFMSGIATHARRFQELAGERVAILDTRKTLPGYRALSKYAVGVGGAKNHRMGLFDMVLIKDNHIDQAGSIRGAVESVRAVHGDRYRIEVECRTREDVVESIGLRVDVIMLDNMSPEEMTGCVALREPGIEFEASGNMSLDRIAEVAKTGVDSISVGALTHSVRAFDFSLGRS